jgi:hypothetical protein
MAFSDNVRQEVMRKSGFSCCLCHRASVSVEVHHIVPQADGGDDSIENAAPLCPGCHSDFGANPEKRRRIGQMRDWWYEQTQKVYSANIASPQQLADIRSLLQNVNAKQDSILTNQDKHHSDLESLKVQLKAIANNAIDSMTTVNSDVTTSAVLGTAVSSVVRFPLLDGEMVCDRCHNIIRVMNSFCPVSGQFLG